MWSLQNEPCEGITRSKVKDADLLQLQLQLYFIRLLVTIDWPAK